MRSLPIGLALAALLGAGPAAAQQPAVGDTSDAQAVLAVVRAMAAAVQAKDTARVRALHEPGSRLVFTATRDGQPRITPVPLDGFLANLARRQAAIEERILDAEVRIDDNLATVWNTYEFRVDGRPDHCGKDAVQLARTVAGWKIIAIADTQRPCAPQPASQ